MKRPNLDSLFKDTLTKRLFLLMWFALVVSHFAAFLVATPRSIFRNDGSITIPTLPSLPPTPGLSGSRPPKPDSARRHQKPQHPQEKLQAPRDRFGAGPGRQPHAAGRPPPPPRDRRSPGRGPPSLPWSVLAIDYGVRLLLIGLAAWIGARWLSKPVKQFSAAAHHLSSSLGSGTSDQRLNEDQGTVEIREATRAFNEMAERLDEQFRSRGLLIASISHDLRTPLTRIRMRLEKCADNEVAHQCINDVREMNELIETVFEIFDAGRQEAANEQTDIFAVVQSVVDDMNEVDPHISLEGESAITQANPVSLRRAVQNLINNALRYAGEARIVVTDSPTAVLIQIDDDGPGIPADSLESVFKPFYRVESSRNRSSGGTGLGLFITHQLIDKQGGQVTLSNRPEGGLRAVITLPRQKS